MTIRSHLLRAAGAMLPIARRTADKALAPVCVAD